MVPYFLVLGLHLRRDLPGIVEQVAYIHKNMEIRVTPPLDGHPALADIVAGPGAGRALGMAVGPRRKDESCAF